MLFETAWAVAGAMVNANMNTHVIPMIIFKLPSQISSALVIVRMPAYQRHSEEKPSGRRRCKLTRSLTTHTGGSPAVVHPQWYTSTPVHGAVRPRGVGGCHDGVA